MAASSYYSLSYHSYQPAYGRLNAADGWCANTNGSDEYLQVDLGQLYEVCGVATQGGGPEYDAIDAWVTAFELLYSQDGKDWKVYTDKTGHIVVRIFL